MSEQLNKFPHLPLRLTTQDTAALPTGGRRKSSATTLANRGNAGGHGSKLKSSISLIVSNWEAEREKRKEDGKPELPDTISFILQVDPSLFDADALKSFGIEVVADMEEGYISGASADIALSDIDVYTSFVEAEIKAAEAQAQARAQQKIQLQQSV